MDYVLEKLEEMSEVNRRDLKSYHTEVIRGLKSKEEGTSQELFGVVGVQDYQKVTSTLRALEELGFLESEVKDTEMYWETTEDTEWSSVENQLGIIYSETDSESVLGTR